MLSMFKDKKGFSVLFNKQGDGASASGADISESSSRMSTRIGQHRCQRCWKNFAIPSGTLTEEYTCWRCDYPTCRLCREEMLHGLPWCCCTCAQPKSLMKLFGKTRYGADLVVHIMGYCDQRSERILKSFFRAAAMKFATARMISNGRSSAQRGSRGGESEDSTGRKPARLSGGLRVQSPSNSNQIKSQKSLTLQRTGAVADNHHTGASKDGRRRSPKQPRQQPLTVASALDSGVVYPDEADIAASFCIPTIGTKGQDGVVEYSPCSKPYAQQQQQQQQQALQQHTFLGDASPLAFGGDEEENGAVGGRTTEVSTHSGTAPDAGSRFGGETRPSAFEREEPVTARTTRATATADSHDDASRSVGGQRMSRTDAEERTSAGAGSSGEPAFRLGASPSPARSESPAPRFPTFAQFLDDQQTMAAQQQLQLQGYGRDHRDTQSRQTISVSPETEEDEASRWRSGDARTGSRRPKSSGSGVGTDRRSGQSRRRTTTAGIAQGSLTPRATVPAVRTSDQRSRWSSLEASSARKMVRRSASGLLTPRGSLHAAATASGLSGRRTIRTSGSRRGGSAANYVNPTILSTPPLAPLAAAAAAQTEQLSRTDGSGFDASPCTEGSPGSMRAPTGASRGSNQGGSGAFMRCATATRLSYGSAQEQQVLSTRVGQRQRRRRPQSAVLMRTGSSNSGLFRRQNSRTAGAAAASGGAFSRTNSSASPFTRTTSSHGGVRQPATRSRLSGGGHRTAHPSPLTRTASSAGMGRFGRTASSSNHFLGGGNAGLYGARRGPAGGASPLTRTASSGHPLLRQHSFMRTHTATLPFTRTQSANAGLQVSRTAIAVPSRLVRTHSSNPTFGRSNTSTVFGAGRRSGNGPGSRTATPTTTTGSRRLSAAASSGYGRRPSSTTAAVRGGADGNYGRVGSTASPLLSRNATFRRRPTSASPLVASSPLKRMNTAMGRSLTPAFHTGSSGATRRPAMAATASERERLVRTPTQARLERQPTRPRTTTPTAAAAAGAPGGRQAGATKATVETAPMLVHMTRRRAGAAAPTTTPTTAAGSAAPSSSQPSSRSTAATTRRATGGSGITNRSSGTSAGDSGTPTTRPLISSRNATPKGTGRAARGSVGGVDGASLKSSDSPRPVTGGHRTGTPGGNRRTVPGAARHATPTGNVFQRLNTGSRRVAAHPSPKEGPFDRSTSKM